MAKTKAKVKTWFSKSIWKPFKFSKKGLWWNKYNTTGHDVHVSGRLANKVMKRYDAELKFQTSTARRIFKKR
jgi:hypothetical protein